MSQRCLKVGEEVRRCLSGVFQNRLFRTPGLDSYIILVTEVQMSADLRLAKVYVTALDEKPDLLPLLKKEAPSLRKQLAQKLHLKFVPNLVFYQTTQFDCGEHIEKLLKDPRVKRDLAP